MVTTRLRHRGLLVVAAAAAQELMWVGPDGCLVHHVLVHQDARTHPHQRLAGSKQPDQASWKQQS